MLQFVFVYPHKTVDKWLLSAPDCIYLIIPISSANSSYDIKIERHYTEYTLQSIFLPAPKYNYLLYKQIELTNKFKQIVVKEKCG